MWDPEGLPLWLSPPFSTPHPSLSLSCSSFNWKHFFILQAGVWGLGGLVLEGGVTRWPQGWNSPRYVQRYSCKARTTSARFGAEEAACNEWSQKNSI